MKIITNPRFSRFCFIDMRKKIMKQQKYIWIRSSIFGPVYNNYWSAEKNKMVRIDLKIVSSKTHFFSYNVPFFYEKKSYFTIPEAIKGSFIIKL